MKLKIAVSLLLIIFSLQLYSQQHVAMFKEGAHWGFIDAKGNVIIKPQYTYCRNFYGELAKVNANTFINIKGEIIKSEKRIIGSRHCFDGLAAVKSNKLWGYMDVNGKIVIPEKYNTVTDFDNGHAIAANKEGVFIIDKQGNEIMVKSDDKIKSFKKISENMAPIEIDGKFGFVNTNGTIQIEAKFITVGYFNNGLAWARTIDNKIGFIDKNGAWIIEPKYIAVNDFDSKSGIAMVKLKTKWEYINIKGESIPIKESNIQSFKKFEDGVALAKSNELWGYLSPEGNWSIKPQFNGATSFYNDYARIKKDGKWGVINKKGEWVLQPIYDNVKPFYIVPN